MAALKGSVSVVSLRQVVGGVATARWRWTPHGGGPPGSVRSTSFSSLSTRVTPGGSRRLHECGWFGVCRGLWFLLYLSRGLIPNRTELALELSCATVSMPQSDRSELLSSVEFGAC